MIINYLESWSVLSNNTLVLHRFKTVPSTWLWLTFACSCLWAWGRCRRWVGRPSCSPRRSHITTLSLVQGCQWSCESRCCQMTNWKCEWRDVSQEPPEIWKNKNLWKSLKSNKNFFSCRMCLISLLGFTFQSWRNKHTRKYIMSKEMIILWGHSGGTPPDHKGKQPFAPEYHALLFKWSLMSVILLTKWAWAWVVWDSQQFYWSFL